MAAIMPNRILLIALLPVVAVVLYLEGQKYDPAMISFSPYEYGSGAEASFFPSEIDEYRRIGHLRKYTKENLYEYVNGHAEYFISAGFTGMTVGEYAKEGAGSDKPDAVVDIYDMGKGIHAFGIFADEAGEDPDYIQAGSMGFKTAKIVGFIKGKYYVKINIFDDNVPLEKFAENIDREIGIASGTLPVFSQFPDLGEVVTTRFVREAYRGLDFVHNVVEREYRIRGNRVYVSLVTGEEAEIRKLVKSFLDFFNQSGITYSRIEKNGQTIYKVNDPYEGTWFLVPFPETLFGVYGTVDNAILDSLTKG